MIQFATKLRQEMERELHLVSINAESELLKAKASFELVEQIMNRLKDFTKNYEFRSKEEEVRFFKEIKPDFQQLLIYYGELTFIESNRPTGDRKKHISYLRKVIDRNCDFIERHKLLHSYYHLGHNSEDEALFLRNSAHPSLYPEYRIDLDTSFSTKASAVLAKLLAFEKLNDHLDTKIELLKNKVLTSTPPTTSGSKGNLVWTDSKAALVELAYALSARGSTNYGNADLQLIVRALENTFNVKVGNYYRTFTDLSNRKKDRTPFLNSLSEYLVRRMDENL